MSKEQTDLLKLNRMVTSFSLSYVLFTVLELGLIEVVQNKFYSLKEISNYLRIDERLLKRFLRVLEAAEILIKKGNKYKLSDLGQYMSKDHPQSIRDSIIMCSKEGVASWSKLTEGLKTNSIPFYLNYGYMPFELQAKNRLMAERFNQSMLSSSKRNKMDIIFKNYDFEGLKRIVDVGGGHGLITMQILKKYKKTEAVIYDLPFLKKIVEKNILREKLEKRCKFISGNFFNNIPTGGDVYILSRILHDWDDDKAGKILQNFKKVMNGAKLLVLDKIFSERKGRSDLKLALDDLNVWVMCGGKERSMDDFRSLFNNNDLKLNKTIMIGSNKAILEVRCK